MTRTMSVLALALTLAGCAAEPWPDPPAIDQAAYRAEYDAWRQGQTETAAASMKFVDVRGGTTDFLAIGQLVFRVNGQEHRLTAFGEPGGPQSFVMFKDQTNRSTTYGGFRILTPVAVANGGWTVLDFNRAGNPPCAYSPFTTCPLPPAEDRLDVAVEAGEKRHPSAQGFAG